MQSSRQARCGAMPPGLARKPRPCSKGWGVAALKDPNRYVSVCGAAGEAPQRRSSRSPPEYFKGIRRAAVFRPACGRAAVSAVDDGRVGAAVEQQVDASHTVVLGREVHGHRIYPVTFPAPVVPQVGIGAMVQQPMRPLPPCRCSRPREAVCREMDLRVTSAPRSTRCPIDSH